MDKTSLTFQRNYKPTYNPPLHRNDIIEKSLCTKMYAQKARNSFIWAVLNIIGIVTILWDIRNICPTSCSHWYYVEYALVIIMTLNVVRNLTAYFFYILFKVRIKGTIHQKKLLLMNDNDIKLNSKSEHNINCRNVVSTSHRGCYNANKNDVKQMAGNQLKYKTFLKYNAVTEHNQQSKNVTVNKSPTSSNEKLLLTRTKKRYLPRVLDLYYLEDSISDEHSLQTYLQEIEHNDDNPDAMKENNSLYNDFGYANSLLCYYNFGSRLIQTSLYQLAPMSSPIQNMQHTEEGSCDAIEKYSDISNDVSSETMAQYIGNLRKWISGTILKRLVNEIDNINQVFKDRGFEEIQIGNISLERLKKTVTRLNIMTMYLPGLPVIVPFLELSSNQEYLVKRIRDLAHGSCISDYYWNSGANYHDVKWASHLPTDAAILFHLFCVYMDSQLRPLPQGCGRPFYSRYIVTHIQTNVESKLPISQNRARCAILCKNPLNPKLNLIIEDDIYSAVYDRNNLFHVIIQFLLHMKKSNNGILEGVNLGKRGINIMCVIGD